MKCMFCGCEESKVVDSRSTEDGLAIRRRRECTQCGSRFTTYEKVESTVVLVVKKDGRREHFDGDKLRSGIIKACEKRPVSLDQIDHMVADIEKAVYSASQKEISTMDLGTMVMDRLKKVDDVAYVRFASVYKQFKDIDAFMAELNSLLKGKSDLPS
ncbi:transcriptional regulator NrdR [Eubacteriales bacterium OttesenSCG-928-M02]|nr:transcriptional regulator NrdR [Eubacteriales bacterium OttesenSCG-928-M02]